MSLHQFRAPHRSFPRLLCYTVSIVFLFAIADTRAFAAPADDTSGQGLKPILDYISTGWDTLTRSMTECKSVVDPKVAAAPVLYLPKDFPEPVSVQTLASECKVQAEHLPLMIHGLGEVDTSKINPPGLLYLPNPYVVPGGRLSGC